MAILRVLTQPPRILADWQPVIYAIAIATYQLVVTSYQQTDLKRMLAYL